MKIISLSFFWGIVFTVLIFAFMCCAIGEDFIRHKDRRHPSLYKYVIFIFMGILLTVFSLLFIILTATNILKIMSGIESEIAQAQKQTILLSILNVFIELFVIGYYQDVLWYVISWIFC